MAEMNHDDPFAFIIELCHISSSQEDLLNRCTFVGETRTSRHDQASPIPGEMPVASAGIVMLSISETKDGGEDSGGPKDVFHTPSEDHCTVNPALDVDDETLRFVDLCRYSEGTEYVNLGRDSDLGFSEVQLTQGIVSELVAECSCGIKLDEVWEISKCQFDKFEVLEGKLFLKDGIGELPPKRLKLSEQGFDSSRARFGIESQKIEEGMGNCEGKLGSDTESPCNLQPQNNVLAGEEMSVDAGNEDNACGEISTEKNLGSRETLTTQVVQSENIGRAENFDFWEVDKLPCTVEGNK